ncbi:FAD-binding oxidoreductase [Fulvimarina sp. 2208YS6-2-32]|uniref:FAD-binding oxidoreductase n=1 Tax=Fulvimarina uroteuthidis TaxID=3098149 RepID=A0ABU5I1S6_9HYPH|nr:FAD-binding oxidoreductase [Fulvimarina sp. 2208YS6-2-32]MDY8108933.1 FAD-binding oxidoreductase [Fulvimarina sp. 2208YS6-2-32]
MDATPLTATSTSPIAPGRSYYEDTVERPAYPALGESLDVDVLIVGGGFTGLSAALHLARTGASVAVLEAYRFGDGASGRNGGQIGTGQRLWPDELEPEIGFDNSLALFKLAEEAKASLFEFIETNRLDVDLRRGQLAVAHKTRYLKDFEAQVEALTTRYAYPHASFMDRAETERSLGTSRFFGGMRDTGTGHLNPLKLVLGTASVAAASGARLFEMSPVTTLHHRGDGRHVARTERGEIRAANVLLATNAYGHDLSPALDAHVMPVGSFIGATEPLDDDTILPGGEACHDSRFVVRYFRKSRDGRLLFGGREAYTSATGDIGKHIVKQIVEVYPQLKGVALTHAWGGHVAITMKRMPFVTSSEDGVTAIGGFSGHGVMLANFAGRLYAERLCGNRDRLKLFEDLDIPPFPGGTRLRGPLTMLAMTWFAFRDRF